MKKFFLYLSFIASLSSCTSEVDNLMDSQIQNTTRSVFEISLTYPISSFAEKCTFTNNDLNELEGMLNLMQSYDYMGYVYNPLFEYTKSHGNKIVLIERNNTLKKQGGYDPRTKKVMFGSTASISNVFPEEFIHFNQDNFYPDGTTQYLTRGKPNIEMEAKIIEDCASLYGSLSTLYGAGPTYSKQYEQWIWDFVYNSSKHFPSMNDVLTNKSSGIGYQDFIEDLKKKDPAYNYESINTLNPILIDYIYKNII
jgi:hypothetical protein